MRYPVLAFWLWLVFRVSGEVVAWESARGFELFCTDVRRHRYRMFHVIG
jgi:hypothetical protein